MQLYARRTSSNCQKVLWFLGEIGLDHAFVATGGDAGGLDDPAYRALNPNAMVPTLVDDAGRAFGESHSTLRFLAEVHAQDEHWPTDAIERHAIERWMDWSQSRFDVSFMSLFWGHWRTPAKRRNEKPNRFHVERCRHRLEILDRQLEGHAYVAGDTLSLADVPVGALMYRYAGLDITADMPANVARWYASLTERATYREHVMRPFDELKGRLAHWGCQTRWLPGCWGLRPRIVTLCSFQVPTVRRVDDVGAQARSERTPAGMCLARFGRTLADRASQRGGPEGSPCSRR